MVKDSKMNPSPFLSLRGISKSFRAVKANDQVDLDVYRGEVHALLGENGAGKSTLMKVLYGFYHADSGEVRLDGKTVHIRSPHDARRLRIGIVFQDFVQVPALTVAENIALFLPDLPVVLDKLDILKRIGEISHRYSLAVDPRAPVRQLSVGERQKVEILKLILADAQILILDEPTRSLALHEIEGLFRVFANLRRDGYAVVFITHKLKEVLTCADRITVMRRGKVTGTLAGSEAIETRLVSLMFEEEVRETSRIERTRAPGGVEPILQLRGVHTSGEGGAVGLQDIDLAVLPGEIVGVAGVSGNGQRELGDVVLGLERCSKGEKYILGQEATHWSVARARANGLAFIPEDPLGMAAFPWLTVQENMAMADTRRYSRKNGFSMDWVAVCADLDQSLQRLGFTIPSFFVPLATLSGGNVQRMILAREMAHNPKLIIAFYPTRGLDVRSAVAARELLIASRDAGAGVLLISEDLGELFVMSDRLVVIFRGRIVKSCPPQETNPNEVGHLMTGSGQ
ncbi:MAG TPA: ABC transporter ATP-binding protein [Thermodesulfobacteriota bacterium]|nr:ABC transporter ATP-binding protein [Thermodesulfobacteriota bacterium]